MDRRGQIHLPPDVVEVRIVAAVRPQRDVDARRDHLREDAHARDAHAHSERRGRAMHDVRPSPGQQRHLCRVGADHVDERRPVVQDPQPLEVLARRATPGVSAERTRVCVAERRMRREDHAAPVRDGLAGDEQLVGGGAHAGQGDRTPHPGPRPPERQRRDDPLLSADARGGVAGGHLGMRRAIPGDLAQRAAEAHPLDDRRLALHLEVATEIGERGRPVADHLEAREHRRRIVVVRAHGGPVRQPLVVLALLRPGIRNRASSEVLRDVRVGVDEAGRDHAAARVDRASGPVSGRKVSGAADLLDLAVPDGNRAVEQDPALRVHGDQHAPGHQQVDRIPVRRHVPLLAQAAIVAVGPATIRA